MMAHSNTEGPYSQAREETTDDYHSDEDLDDMGELSDSGSTQPSFSRPTTPSHSIEPRRARTTSPTPGPKQSSEHYALAHKAEKILGLQPGTLSHAKAALESARDEVRRTADSPPPEPEQPQGITMKGRMSRASKMMVGHRASISLNGVHLGLGGKEEMENRERRRRAADGVLYWQKEVARLSETAKR
ncbi:hypothetical protein P7C73_g4796, partial [Tremellales sp. Uapishka_1]